MDIYLDNSATTRPYKEVIDKVMYALSIDYANPSSLHKKGVEVEKNIKEVSYECFNLYNTNLINNCFNFGNNKKEGRIQCV